MTCHLRRAAARATRPLRRARAERAALALFTPDQRDKAAELIGDGGMVPLRRPGFWRAVSSDGSTSYLVCTRGCNCPAGLWWRLCYHRAAAFALTARTMP